VTDPFDFPGPPELGSPGLVGAVVFGAPTAKRDVVRWFDLLRAAQELDDRFNPDQEAYLSAFAFPRCEYVGHVRRIGSPRGYTGPAACPWLWFDVDRADLDAARRDTLTLARFLLRRYPKLDCDDGLGVWFSGQKGFHLGIECLPGNRPDPLVPATAKRLALALANAAGVQIDPAIYDCQRIFRLPNSRHAQSGLHKTPLTLAELEIPIERIRELAQHPRGCALPEVGDVNAELEADWAAALDAVKRSGTMAADGRRVPPADAPVVPKFVRDFIGFADTQSPGRAVTLWKCSAALSEAGVPPRVVFGLLEEPALKTGLPVHEVRKQILAGIAHGSCRRGEGSEAT
jgi:hypothetical protein